MNDFLNNLTAIANELTQHLPISIGLIILLFAVHILNLIFRRRLNLLGIWPRKIFGWIGIPFSPFLHANFSHLIFNAIPLFIFSNLILLQGVRTFYVTSILIILLSGILTWALGRNGVHVGASSLIMGYLGFILIGIYHKPTVLSVIIGVTCLFYFSGMLSNLFPSEDKRVSWEGHVFGFIAGIVAAFLV